MFGARLMIALMLSVATVSAEPVQQPVIPECDSCTARHKSLQRLQDARVPSPGEAEQGSNELGVILPVLPSVPSLASPGDLPEESR